MASNNMHELRKKLGNDYWDRFGRCMTIPIGVAMAGSWSDEDYVREYEAALESGVPFEPGTPRWTGIFGTPRPLEDGVVV